MYEHLCAIKNIMSKLGRSAPTMSEVDGKVTFLYGAEGMVFNAWTQKKEDDFWLEWRDRMEELNQLTANDHTCDASVPHESQDDDHPSGLATAGPSGCRSES